jgi:glycine cleavage system aminomethyltransferase T
VKEFFSSIAVNDFERFEPGSMKHSIYCTDEGLITAHVILQRNGEEEYRYFAGQPWPHYRLLNGMSGNLAYELHGPLDEGPEIYDTVFRAGRDLGIQRLGWGTYLVNHVEGGFPQMNWTFASAADLDPDYLAFVKATGFDPPFNTSGSVDPADRSARMRTPIELRWDRAVKFDHDFTGRAALEEEAENPRRRSCRSYGTPRTSSTSTHRSCNRARSTRRSTSPRHPRGPRG